MVRRARRFLRLGKQEIPLHAFAGGQDEYVYLQRQKKDNIMNLRIRPYGRLLCYLIRQQRDDQGKPYIIHKAGSFWLLPIYRFGPCTK